MIKGFKHKGLERFFLTGKTQGIQTDHAKRLKNILFRLHFAESIEDMNSPGANLHVLQGKFKGYWAVNVSGNWRIVFRFEDGHVSEVNYIDYH